ncbi:hypothetical protein [Streptosporangium sp. NPDC002524]|uniref:hypothetical protein n=1 Tax=Streptosporangium sp. NPDC002524 TaxID=3154537 RepID=UPI003331092F
MSRHARPGASTSGTLHHLPGRAGVEAPWLDPPPPPPRGHQGAGGALRLVPAAPVPGLYVTDMADARVEAIATAFPEWPAVLAAVHRRSPLVWVMLFAQCCAVVIGDGAARLTFRREDVAETFASRGYADLVGEVLGEVLGGRYRVSAVGRLAQLGTAEPAEPPVDERLRRALLEGRFSTDQARWSEISEELAAVLRRHLPGLFPPLEEERSAYL